MPSDIGMFDTPGRDGGRYGGVQQDSSFAQQVRGLRFEEAARLINKAMDGASKITRSEMNSGTTATIAVVTADNQLVIGQVGDSPVIVYAQSGRDGQITAHNLTQNHSVSNPQEVERVQRDGGFIEGKRVGGEMKITRSFGDQNVAGLSDKPIVHSYNLNQHIVNSGDRVWVVVASDGLTEKARPEFFSKFLKDSLQQDHIAANMGAEAMRVGSKDNISVTTVEVKKGQASSYVLGVMDGHGDEGDRVSKAVKSVLENNVRSIGPAHEQKQARRGSIARPVQPPEGHSLEAILENKLRQGPSGVSYENSSKGRVLVIKGSSEELTAIKRNLSERGIATVIEDGKGEFSAGLRVRSDSMEGFDRILSDHFSSANVAPGVKNSFAYKIGNLVGKVVKSNFSAVVPLQILASPLNAIANAKESAQLLDQLEEDYSIKLAPGARSEFRDIYVKSKLMQRLPGSPEGYGIDDFMEWGKKYSIPSDALIKLSPSERQKEELSSSGREMAQAAPNTNIDMAQAQQKVRDSVTIPQGVMLAQADYTAPANTPAPRTSDPSQGIA